MTPRPLLGLVALFSGVALLLQILFRIDLRIGLGLTTIVMATVVVIAVRRSGLDQRRWMVRGFVVGAVAGTLATAGYDVTRYTLSVFDPSPYNPFEAIRVFGALLVGDATSPVAPVAGSAFHFLNGASFGVAYTFMFARDGRTTLRRAMVSGFAWGVFLELFQIGLYPGWLDIRAYSEFVSISAVGHLVYGGALGGVARTLLRSGTSFRLAHRDGEG
jgi:hypothetical protein